MPTKVGEVVTTGCKSEFYIFGIMVTAYKHNDNTKGVNVRCTTGAGYCMWVALVFSSSLWGLFYLHCVILRLLILPGGF